jgi:hypothetical protein
VPEVVQDEGAQPSDTVGLPPPGSTERAALDRCAKLAWSRLGAPNINSEAWDWFLVRVWSLHADRIRAAHAHEARAL